MPSLAALLHQVRLSCTRQAAALESSPRWRRTLSWWILVLGLLIFVTSQSLLVLPSLWSRALPPEADDSLAYLVRTAKLQECFFEDCPALKDLPQEFSEPTADPEIKRQIALASFPFPFYHPLFSLLLLGVSRLTGDLITAYKVVWSLAPAFFGLGFACFLVSLWGRTATGIALVFLAFRVLPDNGLHYLTPSNLALGIAVLIWARLIRCRGEAPWTLGLGTLALAAMHPLGVVYALISFCLAGLAADGRLSRRLHWLIGACLLAMGGAVLLIPLLMRVPAFNLLREIGQILRGGPAGLASTMGYNVSGITTEFLRLKNGLFISPPILLGAAALGYLTAPPPSRVMIRRFLVLISIVIVGGLFHRNFVSPPGDLFFRLWIPWLAVIYGGLGQGMAYLFRQSLTFLVGSQGDTRLGESRELIKAWPIVALAIMMGFLGEAVSVGAHQLHVTREHMRHRQALGFAADQPRLLLARSQPQDVVVYTAYIPMGYYFVQGALRRGALYYHPAMEHWQPLEKWQTDRSIRFLVAYQPTVYHPLLAGLDEKDQCLSSPVFSHLPGYKERPYEPLGSGGHLVAADFSWLEIAPPTGGLPAALRVRVANPGKPV